MDGINADLKSYIETNVFLKYDSEKVDDGHKLNHVKYVINRSLLFAMEYNNQNPNDVLNLDKVYTIAAYHDIGLSEVDRSIHEKRSAQMLLEDENLKQFFTADDLHQMADAVEDHRASLKTAPRTVYGKIVSQADRDTDARHFLKRTYDYRKGVEPFCSNFSLLKDDIKKHFSDKYGEGGYGLTKIWFPDKDFDDFKATVQSWIADDNLLTQELVDLIQSDKTRIKSSNGVSRSSAVDNVFTMTNEVPDSSTGYVL